MRHQFSKEETMKGVRARISAQRAKLKLDKKEIKLRGQEFLTQALLTATEPERLPYIAAFIYGSIAGGKIIDVLKGKATTDLKPEELFWLTLTDVEVGLMSVMAYGMATTKNQASVAGNASQILGAGFLGGLGLGALVVGPIQAGREGVQDLLPWSWENLAKWWDSVTGGNKP